MSDFHRGDLVYVRAVGTVRAVTDVVISRGIDGTTSVLGYAVEGWEAVFSSDQLELVGRGLEHMQTEAYLEKRRLGS